MAVEHLRKLAGRGNLGNRQRRKEATAFLNVRRIHVLFAQEIEQEAAERVDTEATHHAGSGAQPGESHRSVRARTAQISREPPHLGQRHIRLLRVKVVTDASEHHNVQAFVLRQHVFRSSSETGSSRRINNMPAVNATGINNPSPTKTG